MKKQVTTTIEVNGLVSVRCSNKCQHISKKRGLYTCSLYNEVVDGVKFEDDEYGYGFSRTDQCIKDEIETIEEIK